MNLFERDGRWKGQEAGKMIGLYLSLQGEPFTDDIPEEPEEHLELGPDVDNQWLQLRLASSRTATCAVSMVSPLFMTDRERSML
ncbi:hypothetical protein ACQKKX_01500 [Neorhizobium sp. NPDC001467]|uniref:hypothetical protein n=1 Tax=Neorhizobium sp. NPDC001467 TaxID=3390595 RepID=UPI003CFD3D9D